MYQTASQMDSSPMVHMGKVKIISDVKIHETLLALFRLGCMEVGDLCRISIHLKMFVFLFAYEKMLNIVLTDFLLFRSQLLYSRS